MKIDTYLLHLCDIPFFRKLPFSHPMRSNRADDLSNLCSSVTDPHVGPGKHALRFPGSDSSVKSSFKGNFITEAKPSREGTFSAVDLQ